MLINCQGICPVVIFAHVRRESCMRSIAGSWDGGTALDVYLQTQQTFPFSLRSRVKANMRCGEAVEIFVAGAGHLPNKTQISHAKHQFDRLNRAEWPSFLAGVPASNSRLQLSNWCLQICVCIGHVILLVNMAGPHIEKSEEADFAQDGHLLQCCCSVLCNSLSSSVSGLEEVNTWSHHVMFNHSECSLS